MTYELHPTLQNFQALQYSLGRIEAHDSHTTDNEMMYDIDAFEAESAATNQRYQQALDTLYSLGCKYSITDADMRPLCDHMGVDWDDLMNHNSANSTKETQCQSQH